MPLRPAVSIGAVLLWAATPALASSPTCRVGDPAAAERAERLARRRPEPCASASDAPRVWVQDNIVVMEDDGSLVPGDHPIDIAGRSLSLVPAGNGFTATLGSASWIAPTGAPLFDLPSTSWFEKTVKVTLPFTFPFGGKSYTVAWLSSTLGLWFAEPRTPYGVEVDGDRLVYERTPRISPFRSESIWYGRAAWLETDPAPSPQWARMSWVTSDLEVQLTLHASGQARIDWNRLSDAAPLHGAVEVITGNDDFWAAERELKRWLDPVGDVTVAAPEGPAVDVTAVRLRQLPGTGYTRLVIELAGPPPTTGGAQLRYWLEFHPDSSSTTPAAREWLDVIDGRATGSVHAAVDGSTLEVGIPVWRVGVPGPGFHLRIRTHVTKGSSFVDGDLAETPGAWFEPGLAELSTDLTRDLPRTTAAPLYENFTLGTIDLGAVREAYEDAFGPVPMDAIAAYTSFFTDIYDGGYCHRGNPGVLGIGSFDRDPTLPAEPSGLEMGRLGAFANADPVRRLHLLDHEFGHHFLLFATIAPVAGLPYPMGRIHPAWGVHTPAPSEVAFSPDWSVMGGRFWTDNGDGTFTSSPAYQGTSYWALDLYLMGLADRSEVPDWFYLRKYVTLWPEPGETVSETPTRVGIQELIDVEGPRVPAYPDARRDFRVPLVLVSRPGTFASHEATTLASYCHEWEKHFPRATWTRGTVSCFHACSPPDAAVGNTLHIARSARAGFARFAWTGIAPPPTLYSVLVDDAKDGAFPRALGSGEPVPSGLEMALGSTSLRFFRVAGRNGDCLGPR